VLIGGTIADTIISDLVQDKGITMTTALDVAEYILQSTGALPAMKLQKLVYYCQAWSLVWDDRILFPDQIEAWANGPVVPALYRKHRQQYQVEPGSLGGDISTIDAAGKETIECVLDAYADKSSQWLIDLTHAEKPWKEARGNLAPGDRGNNEIPVSALAEYYGSL
jgi:uncharacterized phage-associated protein